MTAWCHDAAGIGLARIGGLSSLDNASVRDDIDHALGTTLRYGPDAPDRVCCGNMGRIEVLHTAGQRLSRPELVNAALRQAAIVVERAQTGGSKPT